MSDEQKEKILEQFISRIKYQKIKFESSAFFKEQASFFAGVMATDFVMTGEEPNAYWSLCCMSDRSIIEESRFNKDGNFTVKIE